MQVHRHRREHAVRRCQLVGAGSRNGDAKRVSHRASADGSIRGASQRRVDRVRIRAATRRVLSGARAMSSLSIGAPQPRVGDAFRARLALALLLAPAVIWLFGLIVLPHVELALLSVHARVAPRVFEWSLAQYRTFFEEPLYWHTFVR